MRVRVRQGPPEAHCRVPSYLRGKPGLVLEDVGCFRDPSLLAFHKPGLPARRLFRVRFRQQDLWPGYDAADDAVLADLYEHWLIPAPDLNHDP
jgi:hypothetical protein